MKKEGKQGTVMDLTVWDFSNKLSCVFLHLLGNWKYHLAADVYRENVPLVSSSHAIYTVPAS